MEIYIAGESGNTVVLVCECDDRYAPFEVETSNGAGYLFSERQNFVERQSHQIGQQENRDK